ncbi:uncharacterized protein Frmd5 isoform X2 [Venturia canescens]|uniref:uncharacterized protein Frmd5 isoform X2 n=1 Tax=Venturia canescens TaxID=32260 RepID=UPI001C9C18B5|nr:uncharacterized protein LOC122413857 isoform X2 [Venturia canescens]
MLKFGSKNDVTVVHRATIRLLDDAEIIHCDFQPQHKGRYILEYVCKQLNIMETDYFGLRYVDQCRQRHWLDLAKTAIKQVKDMDPILFSFRVKFYPPDPLRLKEEITRYQIYQQLKRDLLHGRLYCSPGEAALLAACIVHSELGEYDPEIHEGNYISEHKLLLKQTEAIEAKAMELHQTQLKGFTAEQAETHFLRLASQLDTYAVDPHPVKDHKGTQLYLGINHCGILTFQGSRQTNHFRWSEVQKINYEGKMFIVHLTINEKKHTVGFKCPTGSNCRHVWRCAIEQMLFFTLPRASDAPVVSGGSIFSWGTKFKYTGRTEREVLEESAPLRTSDEPAIQRCQTTGLRRKASSVPATPSTPSQDLVEIRYSSLPRSCHSSGLDGAGMSDGSGSVPLSSPYCPDNTLPLLETVAEDQEIHAKRKNAVEDIDDEHAIGRRRRRRREDKDVMMSIEAGKCDDNARVISDMRLRRSKGSGGGITCNKKIVIEQSELRGTRESIDCLVRRRINELEKSPRIVRSTALIIKTSRAPMKKTNENKRAQQQVVGETNLRGAQSGKSLTRDERVPLVLESPTPTGSTTTTTRTLTTTMSNGNSRKIIDHEDQVRSYDTTDYRRATSNGLLLNDDKTMRITRDSYSNVNGHACHDAPPNDFEPNDSRKITFDLRNGTIERTKGRQPDNDDTSTPVGRGDGDSTNDYFFRDSFDHSSSESQLIDGAGKPHNRTSTSVPKMQKLQNAKLCLQATSTTTTATATTTIATSRRDHRTKQQQNIQIVRLFIPAFLLTVLVLFVLIVVVFETDATMFNSLRKTPEMIALRNQYYAPIKEFLRTKLGLF